MTHQNPPLAGVIGSPIAHSRSPMLHGHWLKRYGISGHYIPMEVGQSDLADALVTLPKLGFVGLNVTIPHKERVLDLADSVTDRAAVIGAANTLNFRRDGKIHADNTDGYGFLKATEQSAKDWNARSGPAVVFGAGGAARAIVSALIEAGAPEVRITNRTRARADALRAAFGAKIVVVDWVKAREAIADAATVVNTTSLGMQGQPPFTMSLETMPSTATAVDLVYNPLKSGFLMAAEARGAAIVDGLGMLLHQAAPGFERWFGTRPEVDDQLRSVVLAGIG